MAAFGTFVSGQVLTAAELNTAGAWQDYTPTWTQSATITKTVTWARYTQFNKLVIGSVKMTATSAGTASNIVKVSLPVNASANNFMMGTMRYQLASGQMTFPVLGVLYDSATAVSFSPWLADDGTNFPDTFQTTATRFGQDPGLGVGITVASTDIIFFQFMYEAS